MKYIYLSIIASSFIVVGYFPEIYLTILQKHNRGYSFGLWLIAGFFSITYNVLNNEYFSAINYSVNTFLTVIVLILKINSKQKEILQKELPIDEVQETQEVCEIV
jgi:hypothetical protein